MPVPDERKGLGWFLVRGLVRWRCISRYGREPMAAEVRLRWHKLTVAPSQAHVLINEAAIAFVRPATGGEAFELGLISGASIFVREHPDEFLLPWRARLFGRGSPKLL